MSDQEKDKLIASLYKVIREQKSMIEMLINQIPKYKR